MKYRRKSLFCGRCGRCGRFRFDFQTVNFDRQSSTESIQLLTDRLLGEELLDLGFDLIVESHITFFGFFQQFDDVIAEHGLDRSGNITSLCKSIGGFGEIRIHLALTAHSHGAIGHKCGEFALALFAGGTGGNISSNSSEIFPLLDALKNRMDFLFSGSPVFFGGTHQLLRFIRRHNEDMGDTDHFRLFELGFLVIGIKFLYIGIGHFRQRLFEFIIHERADRNERRQRRERRGSGASEEQLIEQAKDAAKEVKKWGEPVTLPKMNAHDRRIIHITLENDPEIITASEGEGNLKKVVVSLRKEAEAAPKAAETQE